MLSCTDSRMHTVTDCEISVTSYLMLHRYRGSDVTEQAFGGTDTVDTQDSAYGWAFVSSVIVLAVDQSPQPESLFSGM